MICIFVIHLNFFIIFIKNLRINIRKMKFWEIIIYPVSLLYGLAVYIRNRLFDFGIYKSHSFNFPVVSVGNLSVGGTGKTPHVEYLIRLLKDEFKIAVLSRGYRRKSKNFIIADNLVKWQDIGDEPMQYYNKFKNNNIVIAVDERRKRGIKNLINTYNDIDVILLDDAFQHRYVKPDLSILLTDYYNPYYNDYLLPSGKLREPAAEAKRADIIVVTKCPKVLSPITAKTIEEKINPAPHQKLFFSYIKYDKLCPVTGINLDLIPDKFYSIMIVAGIANTYPLEEHLKRMCVELEILKFPDHHNFSDNDIAIICKKFHNIVSKNKILVTTEKDLIRFENHKMFDSLKELPFFYVPIKIEFHKNYKNHFDQKILNYVRKNSGNH